MARVSGSLLRWRPAAVLVVVGIVAVACVSADADPPGTTASAPVSPTPEPARARPEPTGEVPLPFLVPDRFPVAPERAPIGVDTRPLRDPPELQAGGRSLPSVRPGGRHHEPRPPRVPRAGEPVVRPLLRHVPGGRRHPDGRERPAERLRARPRTRHLPPALPRPQPVRLGWAPRRVRVADLDRRRTHERVRARVPHQGQRMREGPDGAPVPEDDVGPRRGAHARPDGLPHGPRDPELLEVRRDVHPARPHVRPDRLVDAPGPPVPDLGVVREMPGARRSDGLRQRPAEPGQAARAHVEELDAGRRRAPALHLGRHHVAALQGGRVVGLLRRPGQLRRRAVSGLRGDRDARRAEPAARLPHGRRDRPARQRAPEHRLPRGGARGHAAERLVGDAHRGARRAPARTRSPRGRHG